MIAVEATELIAQGVAEVIAEEAAKLIAPIGPTTRSSNARRRPN